MSNTAQIYTYKYQYIHVRIEYSRFSIRSFNRNNLMGRLQKEKKSAIYRRYLYHLSLFSTYLYQPHRALRIIRSSETGFPIKSRKNFLVRLTRRGIEMGKKYTFPFFFFFFHFISPSLSLSLIQRNDIDERLNFPIGLLAIGKRCSATKANVRDKKEEKIGIDRSTLLAGSVVSSQLPS